MTQAYYDFSLPWNLGFNYTISYSASPTNNGTTGYQKNITQTLGINGSVTILPKMGVTFQGGYDFQAKELTPASITITRDLHCWQDVVRMDSLRSLPELELQHRGQSRLPCRPEVRQEPEHVRQFILNFGRFHVIIRIEI